MASLDIIAIELEARRLRAEDLRRGEPVFAQRWILYGELMGNTLHGLAMAVSAVLRPLFSWNPRHKMS